jgi:hypothetical protein
MSFTNHKRSFAEVVGLSVMGFCAVTFLVELLVNMPALARYARIKMM